MSAFGKGGSRLSIQKTDTHRIKKTRADRTFDFCNVLIMLFLIIIMAYPLYFIVIASLSDPYKVINGKVYLWPVDFTLDSYINVFRENSIWKGYCNTIKYAFKEKRPDSYPLGGGANGDDPRSYLLNALGFLGTYTGDKGYNIALREGEIVIPGGDPVYKEYLTIMKQLYDDGIINPSFFSMEKTAIDAMIAEDKTGAIPIYPYLATPEVEKFSQWESGNPLTSEWNSTPQWLAASRLIVGGCVVTADAQEVETIMRWLDFFYSDMGGLYMRNGPASNSRIVWV